MIFNQHQLRRGDVSRILPPGVIFWGAPRLVGIDTTSTKLTTNRCWTRAMGGEQETHTGGFSLIYQHKSVPRYNILINNYQGLITCNMLTPLHRCCGFDPDPITETA
uniref:Uncharacterized protein n=1 Tax=Hyaloperonospora arabidopsidis (strain Emoy2) TaxID=559515 RepID=M4BAV6_HYAAE